MIRASWCCLLRTALVAVGVIHGSAASTAPIVWIGGNANWDATIANWNPNDEPDSDDEAIFNTPNTVNLANAAESIMALTMSGGIDFMLNGNDMTVDGGNITLSDASTLLDVPMNSLLNTDDVFVNASASLRLRGGTLTMIQAVGEGVLTVAAGGAVGGFGTINSSDVIAAANTTVLSLSGDLVVTTFDLFSQQAGTLTMNVPANGRMDLDQGAAVIDITRNDTLDINGAAHDPAVDAYSGTMNLAEGATLDMSNAWGMNAGSINVNTNGIIVNTAGAAATIAGAEFSQTGGTINLADNLDSLRFSADYTATGGAIINNNGLIIFGAEGVVGPTADFQMNGSGASITVLDGGVVAITQDTFDLGGAGDDTGNVTTIGSAGGGCSLNVFMDFDSGAGDVLDQRFELNGGILNFVNTDGPFAGTDTTWHLSGGVVNANVGLNRILGDELIIQSETINVADATLLIDTTAVEITTPTISIGADGVLDIDTVSRWTNSGVSVTGAGMLRPGTPTIGNGAITADVVWSVTTIDWDDNGPTTIDPGSSLTINADTIDIGTSDGYDSTLNINSSDLTVNTPAAWRMEGVLNIDNQSAIPTINGSRMIVGDANGATVNVGANGGTGVHDMNAPLTLEANGVVNIAVGATFQVDSNTVFEGGQVTGGGNYAPAASNSVVADSTIDVDQFNFDRGSWTINSGATLTVSVGDYDSDSATNAFNSTITINGGRLETYTGDAALVVNAATIHFGGGLWLSEPIEFGNDAGMLDTHIDAMGGGTIVANVTFFSDAEVHVDDGEILWLGETTNFNSVNGVNNATFTGAGALYLGEVTNFNEVTTIDVGIFNLGETTGAVGTAVAVNADTTINTDVMMGYGRHNFIGTDTLTLNGFARLTVNLADPNDHWAISSPAVVNVNASGDPFIGSGIDGSDVSVLGTVNVSGNSGWNARVDIGGTINTTLAGDYIRFGGGSLADPNRLVGGTITGPGTLGALNNDAMVGYGMIDTTIEFLGNSELRADDGILTITGTIADVGTIGTADTDGTLNITQPWDTSIANLVELRGGELTGGAIDNAGGIIRGFGRITAPADNGGQIIADGGTLELTSVNLDGLGIDPNDGDGSASAIDGDILVSDDIDWLASFVGTLNIGAGRSFVYESGAADDLLRIDDVTGDSDLNGDFGRLNFTGGTLIADEVHLEGQLTAAASSARITASQIEFDELGTNTINADLAVDGDSLVDSGATFGGTGTLVNLAGRTMTLADGADIGVVLQNDGTLVLGSSPGQIQGLAFEQTATGVWNVDLGGTALSDFDRMDLSGAATLAGQLEIGLFGGFVPDSADSFTILSASTLTGAFDNVADGGRLGTMGGEGFFLVDYDSIANQVVLSDFLALLLGDINGDGAVNGLDVAPFVELVVSGVYQAEADCNFDLAVNGLDVDCFVQLVISGGEAHVVPEPSTPALITIAVLALPYWRRKNS